MLGAIAGNVIGSVYEARPVKGTDFQLFPQGFLDVLDRFECRHGLPLSAPHRP